jgi:hypothetical protein
LALATVAQLKRWLNIDSSRAVDEDLLQELLDRASSFIENSCNRKFLQATYTDAVEGTNSRYLPLNNYPVIGVTSVTRNGQDVAPSTAYNCWGYRFDDYGIRLMGYTFAKGDFVEVVYDSGFAVIPDDIVHATCEIAGLNYRERDRIGLTSKGLQGENTVFMTDISSEAKSVIKQRRRVWSMR